MSGGRFNYIDSRLKDEIFGWTDEPHDVFEDMEISNLVWDVCDLIHAYDWYASGDTCEETYLQKKQEFKNKWLGGTDKRVAQMYVIFSKELGRCQERLRKCYEAPVLKSDKRKVGK